MKKYSVKQYDLKSDDQERDAGPFWVRVCLASDVADRIAELEKALRIAATALNDERLGTYDMDTGSFYQDMWNARDAVNATLKSVL